MVCSILANNLCEILIYITALCLILRKLCNIDLINPPGAETRRLQEKYVNTVAVMICMSKEYYFHMKETWDHVFVHWQHCIFQLWANRLKSRTQVADPGPSQTVPPPTAVSSVLTTRSLPIRQQNRLALAVRYHTPGTTTNQLGTGKVLHWRWRIDILFMHVGDMRTWKAGLFLCLCHQGMFSLSASSQLRVAITLKAVFMFLTDISDIMTLHYTIIL